MITKLTIFIQLAEFVFVGSLKPLHTCRNAFKNDKECAYAVCWMCHAEMDGRRERQERNRERVRDTDREKEMCDHHNLEMVYDEKYLDDKYRQNCLYNGLKVPMQCSLCYCYITNNSKKVKKVN